MSGAAQFGNLDFCSLNEMELEFKLKIKEILNIGFA